jgi:hypothetical protein
LLLFFFSFNELTTAAGKASCLFPANQGWFCVQSCSIIKVKVLSPANVSFCVSNISPHVNYTIWMFFFSQTTAMLAGSYVLLSLDHCLHFCIYRPISCIFL